MPSHSEGKLRFDFPAGWEVTAYDRWAFYRNQFQNSCCGNKAVDILAYSPEEKRLWLIEVKDYRRNRRAKSTRVWDEVAIKARDTLAGLVAAHANAVDPDRTWANAALRISSLRFVLHLEQPISHSKLFPRVFNPANVQQKLCQIIKPIDAHPWVVELSDMRRVPWSVVSVP